MIRNLRKINGNKVENGKFAFKINFILFLKSDDDVPPGFIGVRGRRSRRELDDMMQALLNNMLNANLVQNMADKHQVNKKSNSIAYKEGFLGVRG